MPQCQEQVFDDYKIKQKIKIASEIENVRYYILPLVSYHFKVIKAPDALK